MMTAKKTLNEVNRRRFLGVTAGGVAALTIVPRHVLGGQGFVSPSDKVNVAIVGAGGQGRSNSRSLFKHADAQIIAVADPNEYEDYSRFYYRGVAGRKPVKAEIEKHYSRKTPNYHVAEYEDFRVMLEKEKDIDAVLCAVHRAIIATGSRPAKAARPPAAISHMRRG